MGLDSENERRDVGLSNESKKAENKV